MRVACRNRLQYKYQEFDPMKKSVFAATAMAFGLVAVAGAAQADVWSRDGVYGSVKGGATQAQDQSFGVEYDTGFTGSAAVGKKFGNYRAEVEGIYQESDGDVLGVVDGETTFYGAMANGYYDFANSTRFTPYVGAGVGYGKVRYNIDNVGSASEDTLAYQGIAGVGYELNPCWSLTGEYRYIGTTKAADTRYQSHSALAGVRYTF